MKNNWQVMHPNPQGIIFTEKEIVNILLKNRSINANQEKEFVKPNHPNEVALSSAGIDTKQVNSAVERLKEARKKNDKIVIFGDYDADGVCSTAIVWETLHLLGFNVKPYIPNRFSEGYGLTTGAVDNIIEKFGTDVSLIITVDNGIVAHNAVQHAREKSIDIIITDHDQASGDYPEALSIIHSTLVSGSAVSWFFAREIAREFNYGNLDEHLDLVAIGTVSDLLPLTGINRSIVMYGLQKLNTTLRPGIRALKMVSGLATEEIKPYHISFQLAPRINAAGRMDDALEALRLICTRDKLKAQRLALKLSDLTKDRQDLVSGTLSKIDSIVDLSDNVIVVSDDSLHEGVIGLIASKLVEKYYRPAIVMSIDGEVAKASARSIADFDIIKSIRGTGDVILEGGGHSMAAGFTIKSADIEEFKSRLRNFSESLLTDEILKRRLTIDIELNPKSITEKLITMLEIFEPYGPKNLKPLFITKNADLIDKRVIGKENNHLKFTALKDGAKLNAIAFGFAGFNHSIADIVYEPAINIWNGKKSIDLKIKDMRQNARS